MPHCASDPCGRRRRWWRGAGAGVTLDGRWVCSEPCVERLVRDRLGDPLPAEAARTAGRPPLRLGALLRHQRACRADQIDEALAAQAESRLRLGAQLRAMGLVQGAAVLRALAAQAGVGYLASVDVDRVQDAPGGLPRDVVLALGLLPLAPPEDDRIRVACQAPVPRAALTALGAQTGWIPEPYLVGDDEWQALVGRYGAGREGAGPGALRSRPWAVHAGAAARRIAAAVSAAGEACVRDVRWGPYVWVRVLGGPAPVDVLVEHVADEQEEKEEPWQAATMSL